MLNKSNTVIGFIGTGVMGKSMASNLMKAGYKLLAYNRTLEKAAELIKLGAGLEDSVAGIAQKANVIITMVGYPSDVEEVYLGEKGIIMNADPGSYLIDMTTSSPLLAKKIFEAAYKRGLYSLDAPVSGGDIGAREARLTIMAGGEAEPFEAMKPIFECMGNNIILQGGAGAGQHTKMCNQIAIASNMVGISEALAYAVKAGLNPTRVLESIGTGAAGSWSLSNLTPRVIAGNYAPGFFVKHFIKDMKIALESAQEMGLKMPGLELAKSLYDRLAAIGGENSGTQALYKLYE